MVCALKGHLNLLRSNKLRRAFSAQIICVSVSQGVALGYDDSAPLGRIVAVVRVERQALQAAVGATLQRAQPGRRRSAFGSSGVAVAEDDLAHDGGPAIPGPERQIALYLSFSPTIHNIRTICIHHAVVAEFLLILPTPTG